MNQTKFEGMRTFGFGPRTETGRVGSSRFFFLHVAFVEGQKKGRRIKELERDISWSQRVFADCPATMGSFPTLLTCGSCISFHGIRLAEICLDAFEVPCCYRHEFWYLRVAVWLFLIYDDTFLHRQ
jgi:hypothetical protein